MTALMSCKWFPEISWHRRKQTPSDILKLFMLILGQALTKYRTCTKQFRVEISVSPLQANTNSELSSLITRLLMKNYTTLLQTACMGTRSGGNRLDDSLVSEVHTNICMCQSIPSLAKQ